MPCDSINSPQSGPPRTHALSGDTGPLVYPAGFVYIYSILYYVTMRGANIRLAQYFFVAIYLVQLALVLRLYSKSRKIPPYVIVLTTFTSYRIHSIYVLRLFNDPVAILFLYAALNLYMDGKWSWGSVCLSLGVSVKMNVLLFAPAIFLLFITSLGVWGTIKQLIICGTLQLILGAPFLLTHPLQYLKGSFDLSRVFDHKWTVNYRFLSIDLFEDRRFHLVLLGLHVLLLAGFSKFAFNYMQKYCRLRSLQKQFEPQIALQNQIVKQEETSKKKGYKKETKKVEEPAEELSSEQQQFLDSFEKSMKNNVRAPTSQAPVATEKKEKSPQKYSIHFDQCTQLALLPIFLCNFIGIACSRSLHYQFYVWYFHSLPHLVWFTDLRLTYKFLLLGLIEYAWNTYPSTNVSSALLHVCHVVLLLATFMRFYTQSRALTKSKTS